MIIGFDVHDEHGTKLHSIRLTNPSTRAACRLMRRLCRQVDLERFDIVPVQRTTPRPRTTPPPHLQLASSDPPRHHKRQ